MQGLATDIWPIFVLSLQVSTAAVAIGSVVGVPLGAWLGLARRPLRRAARAVVYTGMAMPPVAIGLLLYVLLSRSGPLWFLGWLFTPRAMIFAQVLLVIPFVVGIAMNAVAAVPRELAQQLRSLGASNWQVRWALLREARSGILLAVAAALGRSISEVGAVLIVGGNIAGHTRVLTTAIVLETGQGQFAAAFALAALLIAVALALNIVIVRLDGERSWA